VKIKNFFRTGFDVIERFKGWIALPKFKIKGENFVLDFPFNIIGSEFIEIGNNFLARKNLT